MTIVPDKLTENKPLRLRWVMIGFAFLATVLNYIHRLSFTTNIINKRIYQIKRNFLLVKRGFDKNHV